MRPWTLSPRNTMRQIAATGCWKKSPHDVTCENRCRCDRICRTNSKIRIRATDRSDKILKRKQPCRSADEATYRSYGATCRRDMSQRVDWKSIRKKIPPPTPKVWRVQPAEEQSIPASRQDINRFPD